MPRIDISEAKLEERVVRVNRVAKVVKGGRRFRFSAMIVVGDGNGLVGAGMGKAGEVPEAIRKGVEQAKKNVIRVPMSGTTIPHRIDTHFGATKVMLKPAAPGTGVIAGGAVRAVVEAAGIRDILSKNYGSNNPVNVVRAAMQGLEELRSPEEEAAARGKTIEELGVRPSAPPPHAQPEPEEEAAEEEVAAETEGAPESEAEPKQAVAPEALEETPATEPEAAAEEVPTTAESPPSDSSEEAQPETPAEQEEKPPTEKAPTDDSA